MAVGAVATPQADDPDAALRREVWALIKAENEDGQWLREIISEVMGNDRLRELASPG